MIDNKGEVYLKQPGSSGRQSIAHRKYLTGVDAPIGSLQRHFNLHFPQGAIHHATDPVARAMKHKSAGGQGTLTSYFGARTKAQSSTGGGKWMHDNMLLAAKEFEVPASTKMLLFMPEIFDRDLLRKDPKFHYQYTGKDGKPRVGIKTPRAKLLAHFEKQVPGFVVYS